MYRRAVIYAILLIIVAIPLGYYLAPNPREIALMKMKDEDFGEAMKQYTKLYSKGDDSLNVVIPLINLNTHYGNIDQAISLMKSLLAKKPNSIDGHRELAKLYKSSLRFYDYCQALETLQKLSPSTDTLRELADNYNFLGEYEKEMQALSLLVKSEDYKPKEDDYFRLASYYRINGQLPEAVETIVTIINKNNYNVGLETILLATLLLLEKGDEQKAFAIGSAYIEKNDDESDAIMLSSLFSEQKKFDSAYALLTPFLPNIDKSVHLTEAVATLQLALGKNKELYDILYRQYQHGVMPVSLSLALLDLSVEYKNYQLVESVLSKAELSEIPEDALIRYADLSSQLKRPNLALIIRENLGKDYLQKAPLLNVMLDIAVDDTPKALAELQALPQNAIVSPEQKLMVADIYLEHGQDKSAFALFQEIPAEVILKNLDASQFARLYLGMNPAEGKAMLNRLQAHDSLELMSKIEDAHMLLAAGEGNAEMVKGWIKSHSKSESILLSDAYDLAGRYRHNELALIIAKRIYHIDSSVQNRKQLADSLSLNRRYAEALELLQPLTDRDANARAMYLSTMADWIHIAGAGALSSNKASLDTFISSMLKRTDMTLEEKRSLAYLLEEEGFKDKAEAIFQELVGSQSFASNDVSDLLGLWGDKPTPAAIEWVKKRADTSSGAEKAAWLGYLNDVGHSKEVVAIMDGIQKMPPLVADQYITALTNLHSKQQLASTLLQEIGNEANPVRIKKLAIIAREEDLAKAEDKGWKKLYAINNDPEAQKELGLIAFTANHYSESEILLGKYLKQTQGDYRVNYAYAEILQRKEKKGQAKPYFEQAEKQLSAIKEKDVGAWMDEAHLLYRTDHLEQSLELYHRLIAQYPHNKTLRADFAEVLIESKQFDEASLVLSE